MTKRKRKITTQKFKKYTYKHVKQNNYDKKTKEQIQQQQEEKNVKRQTKLATY